MSDETEFEDDVAQVIRLHPDHDIEEDDAPVALAEEEGRGAGTTGRSSNGSCTGSSAKTVAVRLTRSRSSCLWQATGSGTYVTEMSANDAPTAPMSASKNLLRLERNARARLKRIDPEAEADAPERPWGEGSVA